MLNLILYGGSFDPIHNGHIMTAMNVQNHFAFDEFHFLPCKLPVLKQQEHASSQHRMAMIELAIKTLPNHLNFKLDRSEIDRETASYTVITLNELRQRLGKKIAITFLMGYDVFCQLPTWHQWQDLIKLANFLVIDRAEFAQFTIPKPVKSLLSKHESTDERQLLSKSNGVIYRYVAGDYAISSTLLRQKLQEGGKVDDLMPTAVYAYIKRHRLYGFEG